MSWWLLGAALLVLLFVAWWAPVEPTDAALFLGRFHPLLVHLPIGILLVAAGAEVLARMDRFAAWRPVLPILWLLGALGAIGAATAGLLLASGGGYDPELLTWHKRLGIGVAVAASLLYVVKTWPAEHAALRKSVVPGLVVVVLLLGVGSHFGGSLTHGDGYLTQYMPSPLRRLAGLDDDRPMRLADFDNPDEAPIYATLIQPLFDEKCASCHGESASKGGLRLHTFEALVEGGDDGSAVSPGRADESALVHRIWLPLDHDDHMPPAGKPQVTVAEFELLRWWIDQGASEEQTLGEADATPAVQTVFAGLGLEERPRGIFALDVAPADTATLQRLRALGLQVRPLAEGVPFLDVAFTQVPDSLHAAALDALAEVDEQVTWLDLSRTTITDADLAALNALPHLTRLYLQHTAVTDDGLGHLGGLDHLAYLNLYDTAVTDDGLETLAALPRLQALYLWQTGVTSQGADRLRRTHPDLDVNLGWTPVQPASDTTAYTP